MLRTIEIFGGSGVKKVREDGKLVEVIFPRGGGLVRSDKVPTVHSPEPPKSPGKAQSVRKIA